jgi:hypothetical protein
VAEQTKDIDTTMSSPDINRPTDMSRPNTPFGAEVSLDDISTRFCDGTDVREVKSKKKEATRFVVKVVKESPVHLPLPQHHGTISSRGGCPVGSFTFVHFYLMMFCFLQLPMILSALTF